MSPLAIRRYRADRLLQAEFRQLQARVIGVVRGRLGAARGGLDEVDLEACYALAWQGLYAAVLEGRDISNPTGWLVLATYRRAIDEQRSRVRAERDTPRACSEDPDLAGTLDDRERLRELFEGLRGRLGRQERQAAVLCYLHGYTRSEAAARMGISERRMRRLMEGSGPGHPGVSEKLGELAASISQGRWCGQQGSLMRGLAFGILDRDGERYRLALAHSGRCPACRAYVASLRGLASVLPPVLMPGGLGAAILARVGQGAGAAGAHTGAAGGALGTAGGGSGAASGGALGGGTPAPLGGGGMLGGTGAGAAGAGGAGGGWILAGGPLGAKLAAGCLLALGVGAGCVGIGGLGLPASPGSGHEHPRASVAERHAGAQARGPSALAALAGDLTPASGARGTAPAGAGASAAEQARAAREFGPEQAASGASGGIPASGSAGRASTASVHPSGRRHHVTQAAARDVPTPAAGAAEAAGEATPAGAQAQPSQAAREFSPG